MTILNKNKSRHISKNKNKFNNEGKSYMKNITHVNITKNIQDKWIIKMLHNKNQIKIGEFKTKKDAEFNSKIYIKQFSNIEHNYIESNSKYNSNLINKEQINKEQINKEQINKCSIPIIQPRVKFPIRVRYLVASRQSWRCNICRNLLSDTWILDHVIPLFLGGLNEEYNLQVLCHSCDRFKTCYLDHSIIKIINEKSISENGKGISTNEILKIQDSKYWKKMCLKTPDNIEYSNIICKLNKPKNIYEKYLAPFIAPFIPPIISNLFITPNIFN